MPETSPAETLRQAATLMRDRAAAATPGPWNHMCMGSDGCITVRAAGTIRERGRGRVAMHGWKDWKADHADGTHVASWHPIVALAVADWLIQAEARGPDGQDFLAAFKVAYHYLGEGA